MNPNELTQALKDKGYTDYLVDMFVKMYKDLENRCEEYSKLTGVLVGLFGLDVPE